MFSSLRQIRPPTRAWAARCPPQARSLYNRAADRPIPEPTEAISTPQQFLTRIGRGMDSKIPADQQSWEDFWKNGFGPNFKKAGVSIKDRRYALWCMNNYRQGIPIEKFSYDPKPKKTIRGWGPKIVNGKLNRSKRHKQR